MQLKTILAMTLWLSAVAPLAAVEDDRFLGGSFDGWDYADAAAHEGLGSVAAVTLCTSRGMPSSNRATFMIPSFPLCRARGLSV